MEMCGTVSSAYRYTAYIVTNITLKLELLDEDLRMTTAVLN